MSACRVNDRNTLALTLRPHDVSPGRFPQDTQRSRLATFVCPYFGAVKVTGESYFDTNGESLDVDGMYFIVLEYLLRDMRHPSVIDLKIGKVLFPPSGREVRHNCSLNDGSPRQSRHGRYVISVEYPC